MAKHLMEVGIEGGCLWVFAWSEIKIFGKTLKYHRRKSRLQSRCGFFLRSISTCNS